MFWKVKEKKRIEVQSWFNYTIMLPSNDEDEQEVIIVGNYFIQNTGTETLNNPIICIRTNPPGDVRLGGKIGSLTHTGLMIDGSNGGSWEYINQDGKEKRTKTGEYWLKPKDIQQLPPGDRITFANQLSFTLLQNQELIIVEGFCYFDELRKGIASLNKITINF
jgi:hypothetical protein